MFRSARSTDPPVSLSGCAWWRLKVDCAAEWTGPEPPDAAMLLPLRYGTRCAVVAAVVLVGMIPDCSALHVAPEQRPSLPRAVSGATRNGLRPVTAVSSALRGGSDASLGTKLFDAYIQTATIATNLFPLWTVIFTGIALKSPQSFAWFDTNYFTAALAALMLSMGITLTPADFAAVAKEPTSVFVQFSLCYVMMPLLALALGKAFKLNDALLAGTVLVGCINGGQVGVDR